MAKTNKDSFYTCPDEQLEQGDIFRVDIVAPAADEIQRIFRAKDGRHGSVVFEENCDARIFSRTELDNLLDDITRTPLHTNPFGKTPDGHEEMVVVFSRLFRFFVVATQTCDICGIDKEPFEWATVLPVITLADFCRTEPLIFASSHKTLTIEQFVEHHCAAREKLKTVNSIDYASTLRQIVSDCAESAHDKKIRKDAKFLRNYLTKYFDSMYMFLLPTDVQYDLPESYIDFTSAFTVPTSKLLALKSSRFAKIIDPYRIGFAQKFGSFFSRIALPKQMKP